MQTMNDRTRSAISEIYACAGTAGPALPFLLASIAAGFPSPADDYIDRTLDLNEFLVRHPAATFFVRVAGESMIDAGIHPGDILIVDRSIEPADDRIVIAALNGELTVKRIRMESGRICLAPENPRFPAIEITPDMQFEVWGVVCHVIHRV